jgi:hypothetical protein
MCRLGFFLALTFAILVSGNLFAQKNNNTGQISFESECLGIELGGFVTLRVWGNGKNAKSSVEQAKRNALRDVLFKGIKNGSPECNSLPIVINQSIQFSHEEYFDDFFSENGPYKDYADLIDERGVEKLNRKKMKNGSTKTFSVIVRVNRRGLKSRLEKDGIL